MQNNPEIKFGTDGWRGIISDNFTFENVRRVAQAIADYYKRKPKTKNKRLKIAVGYDTRFLSDRYAEEVSKVLAKNGIKVILSDKAIPTPTLSFAVNHRKLTAGVMITASHNPPEFNGIKIKTASGGAAGPEVTRKIEKLLLKKLKKQKTKKLGEIKKEDLSKDYIKFLRSYIDLKKLKNIKFRVLVDVMYGSGNGFIASVLKGTKIRLEFMRKDINPSFGGLRPEPVLENLRTTVERMKKDKFDLCLILDGDADRIACLTSSGEFISPQKILGLLILHLLQDRKMTGGVVKTIVGTNLIDNIAKKLKLKLYETPVGFKYISDLMEKNDILTGGEEAGGMGFKGYIPERDGSLAGLLLLEMMCYRKKTIEEILEEIEKEFGRYYYLRQDLKLQVTDYHLPITKIKSLKKILGKDVVKIKDYDGLKLICNDGSWLMFRGSGTEPIMRVYAESKSPNNSSRLIEFGKRLLLKNALHHT